MGRRGTVRTQTVPGLLTKRKKRTAKLRWRARTVPAFKDVGRRRIQTLWASVARSCEICEDAKRARAITLLALYIFHEWYFQGPEFQEFRADSWRSSANILEHFLIYSKLGRFSRNILGSISNWSLCAVNANLWLNFRRVVLGNDDLVVVLRTWRCGFNYCSSNINLSIRRAQFEALIRSKPLHWRITAH